MSCYCDYYTCWDEDYILCDCYRASCYTDNSQSTGSSGSSSDDEVSPAAYIVPIVVVVILVAAYFWWRHRRNASREAAQRGGGGKPNGNAVIVPPPPVHDVESQRLAAQHQQQPQGPVYGSMPVHQQQQQMAPMFAPQAQPQPIYEPFQPQPYAPVMFAAPQPQPGIIVQQMPQQPPVYVGQSFVMQPQQQQLVGAPMMVDGGKPASPAPPLPEKIRPQSEPGKGPVTPIRPQPSIATPTVLSTPIVRTPAQRPDRTPLLEEEDDSPGRLDVPKPVSSPATVQLDAGAIKGRTNGIHFQEKIVDGEGAAKDKEWDNTNDSGEGAEGVVRGGNPEFNKQKSQNYIGLGPGEEGNPGGEGETYTFQ